MTVELSELVRVQHGAVSRRQLRELGVPARTVGRLPDGEWTEAHPGVFVQAANPASFLGEAWAALLAVRPPAALSHECAARMHGFETFGSAGLVVTARRYDHHRLAGVRVHQISDLFDLPDQIVEVDGLPVTSPARTLVDLSRIVRFGRLNLAFEGAVRTRLVTLDEVGASLAAIARPGKPGLRNIVRVLAMHQPGEPVTGSRLEDALFAALRAAGEPLPRKQASLPGGEGLVDTVYDRSKLIVEADGRRWHARIAQLKKDHDRDAAAAQAGYLTLRMLYEHIVGDPHGTVRVIRNTRLQRERQLAA